ECDQGFDGYCFVCYCWQRSQIISPLRPEFGWHRNIYRCFAKEMQEAEEVVAQMCDEINGFTIDSLILHSFSRGDPACDEDTASATSELSGSGCYRTVDRHSMLDAAVTEPILNSYLRACQLISGDAFSPQVIASPPRLVEAPKGSVEVRNFELEGHEVIIAPDRWSIDGEWVRGGNPILMIQAAIISSSSDCELATMSRIIRLHDRLVGTVEQGEVEHKARILNEELSLKDSLLLAPRLSPFESGYRWGEFHLGLSFLALERFAESWYGLACQFDSPGRSSQSLLPNLSDKSLSSCNSAGGKAIELRVLCMAATGLGLRDCKLSTPVMRSFRFLRDIVDASEQITALPNCLLIKGNSGHSWKIVANPNASYSQVWKVLHISADGRSKSVCIHAWKKDCLPLGDQIAAVALALVDDCETAKRVQTVAKAMNFKSPRA
ncbi:MAG: hypothetical protein NZ777_05785, partial [Pseudomonadales bacterium]|nr:hypothetical protein [Pseudomonadales bacterium]